MDIKARKIAMIKQILNIDNERFISELEIKLIQLFPKYKSSLNNKKLTHNSQKQISPAITEIRKNVSLNKLVAEQQTVPINYKDIRDISKKTKWEHSLAELLEALN